MEHKPIPPTTHPCTEEMEHTTRSPPSTHPCTDQTEQKPNPHTTHPCTEEMEHTQSSPSTNPCTKETEQKPSAVTIHPCNDNMQQAPSPSTAFHCNEFAKQIPSTDAIYLCTEDMEQVLSSATKHPGTAEMEHKPIPVTTHTSNEEMDQKSSPVTHLCNKCLTPDTCHRNEEQQASNSPEVRPCHEDDEQNLHPATLLCKEDEIKGVSPVTNLCDENMDTCPTPAASTTSNNDTEQTLSHTVNSYVCNECGMQFQRKISLTLHVIKHHKQDVKWLCKSCDKKFYSRHDLRLHLKTCKQSIEAEDFIGTANLRFSDKWICKFCYQLFEFRRELRLHLKTHDKNRQDEKEETIDTYPRDQKVTTRNSNNSEKEETDDTCSGVQKVTTESVNKSKTFFPGITELSGTTDLRVGNKWVCKFCKKLFEYRRQLRHHLKAHTQSNGEKNKNGTCAKLHQTDVAQNGTESQCSFPGVAQLTGGTADLKVGDKWICKFCNQLFEQRRTLRLHLRTHRENKEENTSQNIQCRNGDEYICKVCSKVFACTRELELHSETHIESNDKENINDTTDQEVAAQNGKDSKCVHTDTVKPIGDASNCKNGGKWFCKFCHKLFDYRRQLRHHLITHRKNGDKKIINVTRTVSHKWNCKVCNKLFVCKRELQLHSRCHRENFGRGGTRGNEEFDIETNNESSCSFPGTLENDEAVADEFSTCGDCNKKLRYLTDLERHIISHYYDDPFFCTVCHKDHVFIIEKRRHFPYYSHNLHKLQGQSSCKQLAESYSNEQIRMMKQLIDHKVANQKERLQHLYQCLVCGVRRVYVSRKRCGEHRYRHLPGYKERRRKATSGTSQCQICGKLMRKGALYLHMKIHAKSKAFVCEICAKSFRLKHHLDNHLLSHGDVRKHVCSLCGYKFKMAHHLRNHIKEKHKGESRNRNKIASGILTDSNTASEGQAEKNVVYESQTESNLTPEIETKK